MKKAFSIMLVGVLFLLTLSACGQKSQEQVTGSLQKKLENLKGYKAEATMTLQAGEKPSTYDVEIWYQKPDSYRIHLKNKKQKLSQMILKNKDGVFVLTPQLNKSYRFQSDWPKNGSQWYLYESLLKDILNDSEPTFTAKDDNYVFETKTNYEHSDLKSQQIKLTKKDLKPVSVKIKGKDKKVRVDMEFKKTNFDPKFDDNSFNLKKNMAQAQMEVPAMAKNDSKNSFNVYYPTNKPAGVQLTSKKATTDKGDAYVLDYSGDQSFTLMERQSQVASDSTEAAEALGEPVNLGFAIGTMSDHSISWTYDGTDFFLASKDLSKDKLADVARSVQGKKMK